MTLSAAAIGPDALREAQVGALMALAAHSTISNEPAQLVLPTGVGKTEVAVLAPYVLAVERVLVVVPGKLIRSQVAFAFENTQRSEAAGVLPADRRPPVVALAEHRATSADWETWRESDVVVGTPHVLSPGFPEVAPMPRDLFDLVIFDEAHHLPATTWTAMLNATSGRAVLLTATPFRNDGQRLPGKLVYAYPLGRAIERGVYGPVSFRPVDSVAGEAIDLTIAKAAAARLAAPEHATANSRLLVRSDAVAHARSLRDVYAGIGVPLGVIVHDTPWARAQTMRAQVETGELRGFVCVGALTEGFDFPALKVGAYHVPHKTLGPTLQFIGRLSRVGEAMGELLAPRDAVTGETAALYREDIAWVKLLPDLVDSAIDHERSIRTFVEEASVSGSLDLPPMALTPARTVHIFRTSSAPTTESTIEDVAGAHVVQRMEHRETTTLALITRRVQRPRFLRVDALDVPIYELHLVTWIEDPGVLFVSTTSESARRDILDAVAPGPRRPLSSVELRRLLDAADFSRLFSIGTRATRAQAQGTSYQTKAGAKTEDDITPADSRGWDLGHGIGRSGDGTFGFSVAKSKIWEPGAADSLFSFRAWCETLARQLIHEPEMRRSSKLDLLSISEALETFPAQPLVALLPHSIFSQGFEVVRNGELLLPELAELSPSAEQSGPSEVVCTVFIAGDEIGQLVCAADGSVRSTGDQLLLRDPSTGDQIALADYLGDDPPTLFFAGGTRVTGDRVAQPPPTVAPLSKDVRRPTSWHGTAITVEFGAPPSGMNNVGTATANMLAAEKPVVIQDHLPGELADFIAIDNTRLTPEVCLVHCKASGSVTPAARITDVQELAAQACRSVQWLTSGATLWEELRRRLSQRPATQLVHGVAAEVDALLESWSLTPPMVSWSIWIAQPGLSDAALDDALTVTSLLTATHAWISSQNAAFTIVCSP